jgi:hypothetical protein
MINAFYGRTGMSPKNQKEKLISKDEYDGLCKRDVIEES